MKILVACEFSGRVRDAFIAKGHDAISYDLLPSESPGPHIQGNVLDHLLDGWDMLIAFPPCTYLCVSGNRWYHNSPLRLEALGFIESLMSAPIHKYCIENPVGVISSYIDKPDQIVEPYWFGDSYTKQTCLWLDNLPLLTPTNIVEVTGRPRIHYEAPGPNRQKNRSRTPIGLANAMADQWG
jgi:hypothetical protein